MKGFTLVEILVASGIVLILGIFLASIIVSNNGFYYKQSAIVTSGLNANDAMREISANIKQAAAVVESYPQENPTFTTGPETLVVKLPATGANEIINNVYDYVAVYKNASQPKTLRLQVFPDSQSTRRPVSLVLTSSLEAVEFKYYDKDDNIITPASASTVETTITILAKTGSISSQQTANSKTTLRNLNP